MSLTVTSIITVATVFTTVYLAVSAQADDNIPVKNNGGAAAAKVAARRGASIVKTAPENGKRAALIFHLRQKRHLVSGAGITIPGKRERTTLRSG